MQKMGASSSRVTCLTSEDVKRRAIIFPLSERHHKVNVLHSLFCCYTPKRDAFDWTCNSWILDIRFRYFAWWYFAKLWLLQSRWSSFLPFFPKKTQILLDKHENYSTKFNPIFVQVSLISLIYTIAIFMFGDWKYKWNWICKKVLWSNFHTLNQ